MKKKYLLILLTSFSIGVFASVPDESPPASDIFNHDPKTVNDNWYTTFRCDGYAIRGDGGPQLLVDDKVFTVKAIAPADRITQRTVVIYSRFENSVQYSVEMVKPIDKDISYFRGSSTVTTERPFNFSCYLPDNRG